MARLSEVRASLVDALAAHHGPLAPPGESGLEAAEGPFPALLAVALGLAADPRAASRAFDALRDAGLLEPEALAGADWLEIEPVLKSAGAKLTAKAVKPLQRLARWAADQDFGDLDADAASSVSTEELRESWRSINGIGPATADALLLFALGRPAYPVDRATYRILIRHGWLDPSADYDEARSVAESIAPDDPEALAQLALGLEKVGRDFCKPAAPRCDRCPLRPFLPDGGPVELG